MYSEGCGTESLAGYWLINITERQILPDMATKTHSVFVPRPELIAVVVWLLSRPMLSYLNGPLLSLTLPQHLLRYPLTCFMPLAFIYEWVECKCFIMFI